MVDVPASHVSFRGGEISKFQSLMNYNNSKTPDPTVTRKLSNVKHTKHLVQLCNLSRNQTLTCLAQKKQRSIRSMFTTFAWTSPKNIEPEKTSNEVQNNAAQKPCILCQLLWDTLLAKFIQANYTFTKILGMLPLPLIVASKGLVWEPWA